MGILVNEKKIKAFIKIDTYIVLKYFVDSTIQFFIEENLEKTIVYDKNKKGFYVRQRKFEVADMRLLAECVYSAKFIAEGQAKRLVDVICDFVSEEQASKIKHNAFLTDREEEA